ncbi:conserved hypothetical protein [Sphingomonas aurantiaca]|uniref:Transmembrane anchor protein n=1 Tax=Sphingomonas aurantiaca TaxID=185949 RepID=A0A5E8A8Q3_9SPHN|nr:hypothetical protein [Sphingomonas aurantiaca]VVT27836.1 conserved hypothetical protein [Sphingomonas aurantiaca]
MTQFPASPSFGPSLQQLNRATLIAAGTAAVLLVVAVLPAEYGRDPTGIGGLLGLTAIGDSKRAATKPAFTPPVTVVTADESAATQSLEQSKKVSIDLAPDEGREIKALMNKGDKITYFWQTNGADVRYELHGERIGAADGEYTSYKKGESTGEHGDFVAPFDGTHGWYWRNRSGKPVKITVNASGTFQTLEAKP